MNIVAVYVCTECENECHVFAPDDVEKCFKLQKFLEEKCPIGFDFKVVCNRCLKKLVDDEVKSKHVMYTKNFGC